MRIVFSLVLLFALTLLLAPDSVVQAREKTRYVTVFMTFHEASQGRQTSTGKRESAKIVAQNRKKNQTGALPIGAIVVPRAYKDKQSGKWVKGNLPKRYVGDTMGPAPRQKNYLWLDYYYTGKRSAWMEQFNMTWVKIEITH